MCSFVIIVIMIALVLFLPSAYLLGRKSREHAEGGAVAAHPLNPGTSVPSSTPPTTCTKCQRARICANPPPELTVFCV
jgi:hypothetical protein